MAKIDARTQVYAVIGSPIRHSMSPAIQNQGFDHHRINAKMLAFEADEDNLEDVVNSFKTLGVKGFNVTMPCKRKMAELCDELSEISALTGSVNTVKIADGKLYGDSTDGGGLLRYLQRSGEDPKGKTVSLIGAGGAALSIASVLKDYADKLYIINRTAEHAERLCKKLDHPALEAIDLNDQEKLSQVLSKSDLLIHASSVGMKPNQDQTPLENLDDLNPDCTVVDIIYNPSQTRLMKEACERGHRVLGGIGMLLEQGALSFEYWTGMGFPVDQVSMNVFGKRLY